MRLARGTAAIVLTLAALLSTTLTGTAPGAVRHPVRRASGGSADRAARR